MVHSDSPGAQDQGGSKEDHRPRPSFFIVGHMKSGTSALADFLTQHPELCISNPKEPCFFCPSWCRPGSDSFFLTRTEAEYLNCFDHAEPGQLCGDATPNYLYSPESADLIRAFDPGAKLVMLFREPASFLRSYHLQMLRNRPANRETERDLATAIALESARRRGECLPQPMQVPELLWYSSDRLRYDEHYERFARVFPPSQILALPYDDFRVDNAGVVRQVLEFLGVDPDFQPAFSELNVGNTVLRSPRAKIWLRTLRQRGGATQRLRRMLPRQFRRRAFDFVYGRVVQPAPDMDAELAENIREIARPHVARLGEMMGRDLLRLWRYEAYADASSRSPSSTVAE